MRTLTVLLLCSCAEDPIPDDLVDPIVGLWADLDDVRAEAWAAAVVGFLDDAEVGAPLGSRTFAPEALAAPRVELPDGSSPLPAPTARGVMNDSELDVDDWRRLSGLQDRGCVEPADTWLRTFDDAAACWALGTCRDAGSTSEIEDGGTTATLREAWARLDLDDRSLWVVRSWSTQVSGALVARYGLEAWTEDRDDPRRTRWLSVVWQDHAEVSGDALAARLDDGRHRAEDFLAAGLSDCEEVP